MSGSDLIYLPYSRDRIPGPRMLKCRECSADIKLVTHAQAVDVVCPSCNCVLEIMPGLVRVKYRLAKRKITPYIPVGTKGTIEGIKYEAVGYLVMREHGTEYFWREYVLFNPLHGYAWLSEFNGHWNYFTQLTYDLPKDIIPYTRIFNYDDLEYHLYHRYKPELHHAAGEFCWPIHSEGKRPVISEYISPPHILTREENTSEHVWMEGKYMEPESVRKAFSIAAHVPHREGIGSNQPLKMSIDFEALRKVSVLVAMFLFLLQCAFIGLSESNTVLYEKFSIDDSTKVIVTRPFNLTGGLKSLEFNLQCPVSNTWFEAGITMVNDKTGEEFSFDHGVEYYSGYDGEHWTEGSQSSTKLLRSVPDGTYHLNIMPVKSGPSSPNSFTLGVVRDVPVWSNFFIAFALIAIFPVIQWFRTRNYESNRWMNSNFSPYDED